MAAFAAKGIEGTRRLSPVTSSVLHFRPFSGRFGLDAIERPEQVEALQRFSPNFFSMESRIHIA